MQEGQKVKILKNKLISYQIDWLYDNNLWDYEIFGQFHSKGLEESFSIIKFFRKNGEYIGTLNLLNTKFVAVGENLENKRCGHPITKIFAPDPVVCPAAK